jgi:hypothetical protein
VAVVVVAEVEAAQVEAAQVEAAEAAEASVATLDSPPPTNRESRPGTRRACSSVEASGSTTSERLRTDRWLRETPGPWSLSGPRRS